jgi:hypothetical protein
VSGLAAVKPEGYGSVIDGENLGGEIASDTGIDWMERSLKVKALLWIWVTDFPEAGLNDALKIFDAHMSVW